MHPLLFQFGPIAVPTFGIFAAIAVLAAMFLSVRLARVLQINANEIWNLGVTMVFSGLVGSRVLLVLLNWRDFRSAPLWMAGLATMRTPWLLLGGSVLALLTGLVYALIVKLPLLRTLDVLAPSLALGHAIVCLGSFAAGLDYGSPTHLPWAVVYNSRLAARWSGTPQGIPLHPTQLYECALELGLFVLLLMLLRRLQPGEVMGTWLFLIGLGSYFLEFLSGRAQAGILNGPLTLGQYLAVVLVVAGGMLWWKHDTVRASVYTA
ncbi:MAG TPA: prolipoprotein diacylglyceryl transferase family protein [Acidisarcina sp.]|nr:prolipoprotein diacylglyceryl transferase family protein [Acidisarcina sp.]